MVSAAGGGNDATTLNVPRAGAPALAVVMPSERTFPPPSTIRHWSAASNTLASPVIVTGVVMRVFESGAVTVMPPFDDVIGVGAADAVTRGVAVAATVAVCVGVG